MACIHNSHWRVKIVKATLKRFEKFYTSWVEDVSGLLSILWLKFTWSVLLVGKRMKKEPVKTSWPSWKKIWKIGHKINSQLKKHIQARIEASIKIFKIRVRWETCLKISCLIFFSDHGKEKGELEKLIFYAHSDWLFKKA